MCAVWPAFLVFRVLSAGVAELQSSYSACICRKPGWAERVSGVAMTKQHVKAALEAVHSSLKYYF
ncbi:hypothetical protein V1291_003534 [Nitrobacteraceae bacterium AZCC 1564]